MNTLFARLARRLIKARLARSTSAELTGQGEKYLLPCFRRAAARSPAYRILLQEAGVDSATIRSTADFVTRCPVLEKTNTFKRFALDQLLCDDVAPDTLAAVLTSSGHGAGGFALGLSTRAQTKKAPRLIDLGLEMAFAIDSQRSLLINCLPMGVTFNSAAVCVANVSVREDMACAIVQQAGSLFEQIILCGDPLFLKRLCDYSQEIGLDWRRYRVHVIVGEEPFPETFRDYLAGVLGIDPDNPDNGLIGSSMGVGELGLNLFNETRATVALRRACIRNPALLKNLTGLDAAVSPAPTFLVYNPLCSFVEVINPDQQGIGDLVITVLDANAPVPLMRYSTGDQLQLLAPAALREIASTVPGFVLPSLPLVALHGRARDRLPGGGHVDLCKETLYRHPEVARQLSGAHHITLEGETLHWEVQAGRGVDVDMAALTGRLHDDLAPRLGGRPLRVSVQGYEAFPYGKTIDYERKFAYWAAPVQEAAPGGLRP